jgi:peptidoglycan hydrolase-like protein with peptidoglycan-binding domain
MTEGIGKLSMAGALALMGCVALWSTAYATTPVINLANGEAHIPSLAPAGSTAQRETITVVPTPYRASYIPSRSEVLALQKALNEDGARLKVDGVMNQRTMTALLNYQSDHGLAITGTLDGTTKDLLHIG